MQTVARDVNCLFRSLSKTKLCVNAKKTTAIIRWTFKWLYNDHKISEWQMFNSEYALWIVYCDRSESYAQKWVSGLYMNLSDSTSPVSPHRLIWRKVLSSQNFWSLYRNVGRYWSTERGMMLQIGRIWRLFVTLRWGTASAECLEGRKDQTAINSDVKSFQTHPHVRIYIVALYKKDRVEITSCKRSGGLISEQGMRRVRRGGGEVEGYKN
jgi:hypothetical protein